MDDTDVYIDTDEFIASYLYESEPIPESQLPPVFYAKRSNDAKRLKLEVSPAKKHSTPSIAALTTASVGPLTSINTNSQSISNILASTVTSTIASKAVKMENIILSRPLFDKTNTALVKLRRDIKMQKLKGWANYKLDVIKSSLPAIQSELSLYNHADYFSWMPNDDFVILHTLQVILELPLNLQVIAPAHSPNWDLVSDLVSSSYSHYYRSPSECKKRFEAVILKREEMCLSEMQSKKLQLQQQQMQNQATPGTVKAGMDPKWSIFSRVSNKLNKSFLETFAVIFGSS